MESFYILHYIQVAIVFDKFHFWYLIMLLYNFPVYINLNLISFYT